MTPNGTASQTCRCWKPSNHATRRFTWSIGFIARRERRSPGHRTRPNGADVAGGRGSAVGERARSRPAGLRSAALNALARHSEVDLARTHHAQARAGELLEVARVVELLDPLVEHLPLVLQHLRLLLEAGQLLPLRQIGAERDRGRE